MQQPWRSLRSLWVLLFIFVMICSPARNRVDCETTGRGGGNDACIGSLDSDVTFAGQADKRIRK